MPENKDGLNRHLICNSEKELVFDKKALLSKDFINQLGYLNRFIVFYLMRCDNAKVGIDTTLMNIDKYVNAKHGFFKKKDILAFRW